MVRIMQFWYRGTRDELLMNHKACALKGDSCFFIAMRDRRFFICRVRSHLVLGSGPKPKFLSINLKQKQSEFYKKK